MSVPYAHEQVPRKGNSSNGEGIVYWLAEVCKHRREQLGRQPVHIAAVVPMNPTTVTRFEGHETRFAGLERLVEAYASDLGIPAHELWQPAIDA